MKKDAPSSIYEFLFGATSDILFLVDGTFRVLMSSKAAQSVLRLPETGRGFLVGDLFADHDRDSIIAAMAASIASTAGRNAIVEIPARLKLADMETMPVHVLPRLLWREANDLRAFVLMKPLSGLELYRAGSPISRALDRYDRPALLVEAGSLEVSGCNGAARALFGMRREELVGMRIDFLTEAGYFSRYFSREVKAALESVGLFQARMALRRRNGSLFSCFCTYIGLFDGRGDLSEILCVASDCSEEEERMAEIRRISQALVKTAVELDSITSSYGELRGVPRLSDFGLSERQIAVARLVVSGASSKSIAYDLGIAEATVKSHITVIFKKLGVKSRTELVSLILEQRLAYS